jgi:glucose/arabinose dehydrogenase
MKPIFSLVFLVALFACKAQKKEQDIPLTPDQKKHVLTPVVTGIEVPWGMDWLDDKTMIVTERSGGIFLVKDGVKTEVSHPIKVYARNQGGMLDVKVHPKYAENGWIYFTFSSTKGDDQGANTELIRAKINNNQLVEIQSLYKATPNTSRSHHFGSRIVFDAKGDLYFTVGDRGNHDENPQFISRDGGKVYRLKEDGSIPADNPFVHVENSKPAVYSYGHRNPQGMSVHPITGEIWVHEHGPRGGDEINVIKKGANYGWPVITYGINYNGTIITNETKKDGMEQPLYYWVPSIAPSGMTFVTSDNYPEWKNHLLVGSLVFQYVEFLKIENNQVVYREKIAENIGRVRDVQQGPDGLIYVAVEGKGIFKIEPTKK